MPACAQPAPSDFGPRGDVVFSVLNKGQSGLNPRPPAGSHMQLYLHLKASLLISSLLFLGACGEGATGQQGLIVRGVQHLDPRLEDGRGAAEVLGATQTVVSEVKCNFTGDDLGQMAPWSIGNAQVESTGPMGLKLGPLPRGEGVEFRKVRLHLGEVVEAGDFNVIEVDVQLAKPGFGRVTWRSQEPIPGTTESDYSAPISWEGSNRVQTLRFPVAGSRGWQGTLKNLSLTFTTHYIRVLAIRTVQENFGFGNQPSADFGEPDSDGGLLEIMGDERRTWPSDFGVPLVVRGVVVPAGGRVVVSCALPGSLMGLKSPVHFHCDVRTEGGAWKSRGSFSFTPRVDMAAGAWNDLTADIADLGGQTVDVRFRAWLEGSPSAAKDEAGMAGTSSELQTSRVWWATPMVLGEMHEQRRPNLLLVTMDTTRIDRIGAYGGPAQTPFLDELARQGILFEEAWSACNSTLPSHASIFTGLSVPSHGLTDNSSRLAPEVRTLAQALRADGYRTAAAVSVGHLESNVSGLGRGFDQYHRMQAEADIDGAKTVAAVSKWLKEWQGQGEQPFFLWVHLFDPHTPYGAPEPWLGQYNERYGIDVPPMQIPTGTIGESRYTRGGEFLAGVNNLAYADYLYQTGVSYGDHLLSTLDQALVATGAAEDTALVVTSDHGEALGEGEGDTEVWFSHKMLFDPIMHVPLIMRLPDGPRGHRVRTRVSHLDLAGSLTRYLGAPGLELGPKDMDLMALAENGDLEVEGRRMWFVHANNLQLGLKQDGQTYFENLKDITLGGPESLLPKDMAFLYEPGADPGFARNLAEVNPERVAEYRDQVADWIGSIVQVGQTLKADLTAEQKRELESLGYMGDE